MAAWQKFNSMVEFKNEGVFNMETHTLKFMLTNTLPTAANTVKADIVDIAAGNGYIAGGVTATLVSSSQTGGIYKLVLNDPVITAVGGSIGPFRAAVCYDSTPTTPLMPLIGFLDYGSSVTLLAGESLTIDTDQVGGLYTDQ